MRSGICEEDQEVNPSLEPNPGRKDLLGLIKGLSLLMSWCLQLPIWALSLFRPSVHLP